MTKLPPDDNWKEVKAALPGKKLPAGKGPTTWPDAVVSVTSRLSVLIVTLRPRLK